MLTLLVQRSNGATLGSIGPEGVLIVAASSFDALCNEHPAAVRACLQRFVSVGAVLPPLPEADGAPLEWRGRMSAPDTVPSPPTEEWRKIAGPLQTVLALRGDGPALRFDRRLWSRTLKGKVAGELLMARPEIGLKKVNEKEREQLAKLSEFESQAFLVMRLLEAAIRETKPNHAYSFTLLWNEMEYELNCGDPPVEMKLQVESDNVLAVTKTDGPLDRLKLHDVADGFLQVRGTRGNDLLLIGQSASGTFVMLDTRDGEMFLASEESFLEFARIYPEYTEKWLLPLLKYAGVAVPLSPFSAQVKDAALAKLVGRERDDEEEVARLIAELDHRDFRTRERATEILAERVVRYREALVAARANPDLTPEQTMRLDRILATEAGSIEEHADNIERVIFQMRLLDNPKYLRALLDTANEPDRAAIEKKLDLLGRQP